MIDPGGAFGTGTHPTTRMCLELLLEATRELRACRPACGRSRPRPGAFTDLGCGSGVLAIAAAKLGFDPVLGVDADRAAVEETRSQRARQRRRCSRCAARTCGASRCRSGDVAAANLTARLLRRGGRAAGPSAASGRAIAIVSGFLREQADDVEAALSAAGLAQRRRLVSGDWAAILAVVSRYG